MTNDTLKQASILQPTHWTQWTEAYRKTFVPGLIKFCNGPANAVSSLVKYESICK